MPPLDSPRFPLLPIRFRIWDNGGMAAVFRQALIFNRPSMRRVWATAMLDLAACGIVLLARWFYVFRELLFSMAHEALGLQSTPFVLSGLGIVAFVISLLIKRNRAGWPAMKEHLAKHLLESLVPAAGALLLFFLYNVIHTIPARIYRDARVITIPNVPASSPPPYAYRRVTRSTKTPGRQLKLIFKDSPLFTAARKESIADQMEEFYLYLKGIGFDPPTQVPPLGTGPIAASAGIFPGPAYWGSISIAEKSVDDPLMVHSAYAQYAFPVILNASTPGELTFRYRLPASLICHVYYVDSFDNHEPTSLNPGASDTGAWVAALWEIRRVYGRSFADSALMYAIQSFDDEAGVTSARQEESFSQYFYHRFSFGEQVVDNQFKKLKAINDILRRRNLIP